MKLGSFHSDNKIELPFLISRKIFAYTDILKNCLDIIGRVKISEYNSLCPFLSQDFTFFFRLEKKIVHVFFYIFIFFHFIQF